MNDQPSHVASVGDGHEVDLVASARDRIAALLNHDDELCLGMAIFDLWAAFDELVDPLNPPDIEHIWFEDAAGAMRAAHTELVTAIATAHNAGRALAIGRAAGNVASALATYEQDR